MLREIRHTPTLLPLTLLRRVVVCCFRALRHDAAAMIPYYHCFSVELFFNTPDYARCHADTARSLAIDDDVSLPPRPRRRCR